MSFIENATKVIDGQVYLDEGEGNVNLVDYCNEICQKRCGISVQIDNPPECDCEITRLYFLAVKLAEYEAKTTWKEFIQLQAERDKYKEALKEISNYSEGYDSDYRFSNIVDIVSDALKH